LLRLLLSVKGLKGSPTLTGLKFWDQQGVIKKSTMQQGMSSNDGFMYHPARRD